MSVLSAVKEFIATFTELDADAPLYVNHVGDKPTQYGIYPMPNSGTVEEYLNGASIEEFFFIFQSAESTADEAERIDTFAFYEDFSAWIKAQDRAENFPSLDDDKTPYEIETISGQGFLSEEGESSTAIYQIQCRLEYHQAVV